jgi:hypothetical protein
VRITSTIAMIFFSFVLFTKVLIDMHCSPSHGYSVNMRFLTDQSMVIPFERKKSHNLKVDKTNKKKRTNVYMT